MISIRVRLFGPAEELAGAAKAVLNVEDGMTLGGLAGQIAARWPKLGDAPGMRLAVNRRYVALDHLLCEGDEIAVIPPVTGG